MDKIANGEVGDMEEVHPHEDPTYKQNLSALRYYSTPHAYMCALWSWSMYTAKYSEASSMHSPGKDAALQASLSAVP